MLIKNETLTMLNYHLLFSKVYYEPGCIALIIACCVVTDPWLGLFAASGTLVRLVILFGKMQRTLQQPVCFKPYSRLLLKFLFHSMERWQQINEM